MADIVTCSPFAELNQNVLCEIRIQGLYGHDANDFVAVAFVNRQIAVTTDNDLVLDGFVRFIRVQPDDFWPRRHEVASAELVEFKRAVNNVALHFIESAP